GPLLGGQTTQQQTGNYYSTYTPPQPNPWTQGIGLGLTALGMFGVKRGGLIPRKFQAGGLSLPSNIVTGGIAPLQLASRALAAPQVTLAPMQIPGMPKDAPKAQQSPWDAAGALMKGLGKYIPKGDSADPDAGQRWVDAGQGQGDWAAL